jgi:hypothetical protein
MIAMASYTVATVRRGLLKKKKEADALSTVGDVCKTAAQCKEVQTSKLAQSALDNLQTAVTTAGTSLTAVQTKEQELRAARKTLRGDMRAVKRGLSSYESAVDTIADGNATVIANAGLKTRQRTPTPPLEKVVGVTTKPGSKPREGVISWPPAPGATSYAIQVNLAPESPTPNWNEVGSGTSRRRVLEGPAPGAQILARVAAIAADGTRAEWSDPVLVTVK